VDETGTQQVVESRLAIMPEPQYLSRRTDYFGNVAKVFMVQQPHKELVITSTSIVETSLPVIPPPASTPPWETVARRLNTHDQSAELEAYQRGYATIYATTLSKSMPVLLVLHAAMTARAAWKRSTCWWFNIRVFGLYGMVAALFLCERLLGVTP